MQNIPFVGSFTIDKSTSTHLDKKWKSYLEEFQLFITASGVTENKQKTALLLHLGGKDLRGIYYKTVKAETDTIKKKLLQQENLTLEKLLEIGRNKELGCG